MEQKKVGAEAGAAPVFALKWLANFACDANACAYKILYKAEEKKKRQSVQSKAGTDGGLAGPVAPSRQKKDLAFKETQGQDCHDSCDGDLRPRPLQLQWLCAKVPRGGALPPQTLRSPTTRAKGQVPNIPKPRLCALLCDLDAPAFLARCEALGIGVSGCCMMQTDDAGRLRLQRWRPSSTPAQARRYHRHRGGAVPARPGPGNVVLKIMHCRPPSSCPWHLTGGKQSTRIDTVLG